MDKSQPEQLAKLVLANVKYSSIAEDLIFRLCQDALTKGLIGKPAVKYVRNKLHQVGGAYFKAKVNFAAEVARLANLPLDLHADTVKNFCRKMMAVHASTAERLPILEVFFHTCLAPVAPITSVLDLACGLNPLAAPWMPLAVDAQYFACDIYADMLGLVDAFFKHVSLPGKTWTCDLIGGIPAQSAQVSLLLKSIPCLEQLDKSIAIRMLDGIQSEHILVSFPVHSLGGRDKGMGTFYRDHFNNLMAAKNWLVREFHFKTELAFLVSK